MRLALCFSLMLTVLGLLSSSRMVGGTAAPSRSMGRGGAVELQTKVHTKLRTRRGFLLVQRALSVIVKSSFNLRLKL